MSPPCDDVPASDAFLQAVRCGDAHAWEQLMATYRPYLLAIATRTLGNQSGEQCSSVVQDGLVRALEQIQQFRGQSRAELLGWLSRIVANKARDRLARAPPMPLADDSRGEPLPAKDSTPSSQLMKRERAALVLAAIDRLPADYREVIHQRVFLDLEYHEIAARMGRSNNAVRWLYVRAIRQLREQLGDTS